MTEIPRKTAIARHTLKSSVTATIARIVAPELEHGLLAGIGLNLSTRMGTNLSNPIGDGFATPRTVGKEAPAIQVKTQVKAGFVTAEIT